MMNEVLSTIKPDYNFLVDGTLWHGWHSSEILRKFPNVRILWLDVDENMIKKARVKVDEFWDRMTVMHSSYAKLGECLKTQWGEKADWIFLDLGVNLEHFKDSSRWFSIKGNAELDMRFDMSKWDKASDILNNRWLKELMNIFIKYWDFTEKKSEELALAVLKYRSVKKIETTYEFREILANHWLGEKACAVIFQTLRIATNWELDNLDIFLNTFQEGLTEGGRCVILTYHSIEDRMVKLKFRELDDGWNFQLVYKKVVFPHYLEVQKNKAARSAKMRVIELVKN